MAYVELKNNNLPGIVGLLDTFNDTAKPLSELAHILLSKESSTFSKAERETLAAYVSYLNNCIFCSESHAAIADKHWGIDGESKKIWNEKMNSEFSERFLQLLKIAKNVQTSGREVLKEDIEKALMLGASEKDIHDAILIAAAFCMYNRYVDGLGTLAPTRNDKSYLDSAKAIATNGYLR